MTYRTAVQQHDGELGRFIDVLKRENVRSYLEIGSKFGGSLWRIANALPKGSRVVAVDLPWGNRESLPHLEACVAELQRNGYVAELIIGDSTSDDVIERVRASAPFDACLIDANHTEPYVRKDWANYGPMCRIVAFHDIGWVPRPQPGNKLPIDVPVVWNEIKAQHPSHEIRLCPRDNGIGVLWRC